MSKRKKKKPFQEVHPPSERQPRGIKKAQLIESNLIAWHLRIVDQEGRWGWNRVDQTTFWKEIFLKISDFETMTYSEILGKDNHEIPVSNIIREARTRLKEIEQDDVDHLVSLHITGKKMIWGIRDQNIFKVLWWDPNHEICPSAKKHT